MFVGDNYFTQSFELSYALIYGSIPTLFLILHKFAKAFIFPGNIHSIYRTNSYTEKSIRVKYPKNHYSVDLQAFS